MSDTSTLIFDLDSWKRALSPTFRVVGYSGAIYVIVVLVTMIPLYLTGASVALIQFFSAVNTLIFFFSLILSIFKVIDEDKAKPITTVQNDAIKLI